MLQRKSVISKALEVGSSTLASRLLGIVRETLTIRFLGVGIIPDAFFTAFKIPNSLRKIFAEGALSVSFIPTFVQLGKSKKRESINSLMTLSFLVIQTLLIALCVLMYVHAETVLKIASPGWFERGDVIQESVTGIQWIDSTLSALSLLWTDAQALPQVAYAVTYLRLLMAFIVFLSSSSLLAGALQSVGHFFVPAFAPVLLNLTFIAGLLAGLWFGLSVEALCGFIVAGGLVQFVLHIAMYWWYGFTFGPITRSAWKDFVGVMRKFLPCFVAMSIMEIGFFVDSSIASFLPAGSISMMYYAFRFMGIPFGVFVTALSTVLLPYFSHIRVNMPERLSFYMFEAAKLYFWITLPLTLLMSFLADKFFITLFLSSKFTMAHVGTTSDILIAYLVGLFFFACNKLILNMYYAMHDTITPMFITIFTILLNGYLSYWVLMEPFGVVGIALATTIAAAAQAFVGALLLWYRYDFTLYVQPFFRFAIRYSMQVGVASILFYILYTLGTALVVYCGVPFFITGLGFWLWVGPVVALIGWLMHATRSLCGIKLYFID